MNKKAVFAIGTLAVFLATSICTVESVYTGFISMLKPAGTQAEVQVSFAKEYPYEAGTEQTAEETPAPKSAFFRIDDTVSNVTDAAERHFAQVSLITPVYNYLFGFSQRAMGRSLIEDEEKNVYRLENEKLVLLEKWNVEEANDAEVTEFMGWLGERDIDFLYVFPVSIADDESIQFPQGMETGYDAYHKTLIAQFTEHNVPFLDSKPYLLSLDEDFFHWVYRTDHHWNVRAGILTTGQIMQAMRDTFGYDVDPSVCEIAQYDSVIYPAAFRGSLGRKVTSGYAAPEDIEFLYPKFDTRFHIEIPTMGLDKTDTFENAFIDKSVIHPGDNAYGGFMYADRPLVRIHNENCTNGIRVLMLKQSKANVITPYLACGVEYLDIIDPRFFDGSVRTFVTKTNPDIVIICSADLIPTD